MENQEQEVGIGLVAPTELTPEQATQQRVGLKNSIQAFILAHTPLFSRKVTLSILAFTIAIGGVFLYVTRDTYVAVKQFTNVYTFVPEKISKSAPIQISLPEGVTEDEARAGISFSPEIAGTWVTEEIERTLIFEPKEPMKVGIYYAVNMDTTAAQMSGDFYVDEDPQVQAIFPAKGSETHEDSEITIVFNRPMVPLTTLTEQESVDIPVTITPETPGTFKWISTRNLQFIPETTLTPASQYTVQIGEGFVSVDGLPIEPLTHTFITRPLRYEYVSSDGVGYRSPIVIDFNQPVDLDATAGMVHVTRADNEPVSIEIEYGTVTHYDWRTQKHVTEADKSKLFVYQKKDRHGRKHLWDFDTRYGIRVEGGVPLEGDVDLAEERTTTVSVANILESVTAESERSQSVRPDLFDPQGTLVLNFYEDVNKDRSDIEVRGLRSISYGERCKTDERGEVVQLGSGCEKEEDTKKLILSFESSAFGRGELFTLMLDEVVATDGFTLNAEPVKVELTTYPALAIYNSYPSAQSGTAPLNALSVCTNAPLKDPGEEGLDTYVKTDGYIVYGNWSGSRYIERKNLYTQCDAGQFETEFSYGLHPQKDYTMHLTLTDEFGQTAARDLSFRTTEPGEMYTRFHNMQQQYNVTTPGRTKFTYAVENLEYVDMHICRLSPEIFLEYTMDRYSETDPPDSSTCLQVVNERVTLPPVYWVNNYFQVDIAKYFPESLGHYIITFSNPLYRNSYNEHKQLYDRTYVSVTNLAVGKKEIERYDYEWNTSESSARTNVLDAALGTASNLYWVSNSSTLAPVVGATITQYTGGYNRAFAQKSQAVTDWQGIARGTIHESLAGAVVRFGADSAVVSNWSDMLSGAGGAYDASRTYIYTDRPIYRPTHTVYIRGIDRIGFDGSYEIWNKDPVPLTVYDSRGTQVYETKLTESAYGTFATSFELPKDAALGTYRIEAYGQSAYFSVEEYVPAAFKVEARSDKEEYINNDTFTLDVQADYYFGVPVSEGAVSYSVTAQDFYFDRYTDEYFNFGSDWYYCYSCGYGDSFLFRGEATLDENGMAHIERKINLKEYFETEDMSSKIFTVSLTAKDLNGRSVSAQKSFIVHAGEFYIGAKTDKYYTGTNAPIQLRVKTVDTQGKSVPIKTVHKKIFKVSWDIFKRQEVDGGFYYRSEKKLEEIGDETVRTDDAGNWSGTFTLPNEGQYEIHVGSEDGAGNTIETVTNVYIYGTGSVELPPNNNYELDLEVEQSELEVGETASMLIKSPYDRAKALIAVERGVVHDYWIVDVLGGLYQHTFPIKSDYTPNIFTSVLLLSPSPEVKYGSAEFKIGTKEKKLSVNVSSNKVEYLPGEEVTLSIETKDYAGNSVPAEVSIAVADLSVLALKGNPKKDPLLFFYDGFPLSVSTASNIKNILYEIDIPLGTKGGGGGDPEDLAARKRGLFKDTAFWESSVETDQSGKATATFTLPDNLTTWQVESIGVTKDTKLGVDYDQFTTKKKLMAVPLKPRFVVPGDTFSLGATVYNETDADATVVVSLTSETLTFTGEHEDSVKIGRGESKTVYFDVVAPQHTRAGAHTFTFSAYDGTRTDVVEQSIPVTPNTTYETVATANFTKDDRATEYLYVPKEVISGEGGLTIHANATMAVFMTDALTYMATYPYGCSEQLASSLSTIGILTSALTLPNVEGEFDVIEYEGVSYTVEQVVEDGLFNIYETQTFDGGFGYYKGMMSDLFLTLHVVTALTDLKEAGYPVRQEVLDAAGAFIVTKTKQQYSQFPDSMREAVILAEYVLRRMSPEAETQLTGVVRQIIKNEAFVNEKISSMTLAYLAVITADGYGRDGERVYDALKNRIGIDGRGAYLGNGGSRNYEYFETSVKNTALLLSAFVAHKDENPAMGNVLRWLLASRDHQNVWGSTHNTFVVVKAMVEYLEWQHETESHFTLTGMLDGVEVFGYEFNPKTVFNTFTHFIPIDTFAREKLLPLVFERKNKTDMQSNFYYDMSLKYFLPVELLPPRDEGITITRNLYGLSDVDEKSPISTATVGDVVRGKVVITTPGTYRHIVIEDFVPAGFEIVNFDLATEDQTLDEGKSSEGYDEYYDEGYYEEEYDYEEDYNFEARANGSFLGSIRSAFGSLFSDDQVAQMMRSGVANKSGDKNVRTLRPSHTESHDDRIFLYTEALSPGVYVYEYYLRALVPGKFQHLPARAEEFYFPEVFGRTSGDVITVTPLE
jgi:uncharacterized protein YfaS (alpha-2-macroglobulin family)